jgi:branched-chain amino acid transport system substrate-binding protein
MLIILLVVGLVVGLGAGYFLAPAKEVEVPGETVTEYIEVHPLDGKTIQMGNIYSDDQNLETTEPLIIDIMTPRMNDYLDMLGYDVDIEFLNDHAQETPAIHLEKVQGFHSVGVDLVIGGRWSSQAQSALSYVNENEMLLFSPSSTSPLLAIPDDNLYRMCPTDVVQSDAIAEMLFTWGIEAVAVIQRVDPWADGIYNLLVGELEDRNMVTKDPAWRVSYNPESKEFASDLETLEGIVQGMIAEYGAEKVGVLVIGFSEVAIMVSQAEPYDGIYNQVRWFGTDGTAIGQRLRDDSPAQSGHLQIPSTLAAPGISPKFRELNATYFPIVGQVLGYYSACTNDIAWVLMQGVLESQGTVAADIIPFIDPITDNHYGASGWTKLNADGDRFPPDYEIWGYGPAGTDDQGNPLAAHVHYGTYYTFDGTVEWFTDRLGFVPPGLQG